MPSDLTMTTTVDAPWDDVTTSVRAGLAEQGFGVLTEIDVSATLRSKLGVDTPRRVILGACRPELAHRALEVDPRVATLLPCNVVVTEIDERRCAVDALDPAAMTSLVRDDALGPVVADARDRLARMLSGLSPTV